MNWIYRFVNEILFIHRFILNSLLWQLVSWLYPRLVEGRQGFLKACMNYNQLSSLRTCSCALPPPPRRRKNGERKRPRKAGTYGVSPFAWKYIPCRTKFLREFIFADWRFFGVLRELIFAVNAGWFFLLGINFLRFSESTQYPALILFSFLVNTYHEISPKYVSGNSPIFFLNISKFFSKYLEKVLNVSKISGSISYLSSNFSKF